MKKLSFLSLFILLFSVGLLAQHDTSKAQHKASNHNTTHHFKHFRAALGIDHTYIRTTTASDKGLIVVPAFSFDIEYWVNHHWAIGFHNDAEMLFTLEGHGDELLIENEYPIVLTLDALWHAWKGLIVFGGPGIELEPDEHIGIFRLGLEYEIPIGHDWDVFPSVFYDTRFDRNNAWTTGLGVGKRF